MEIIEIINAGQRRWRGPLAAAPAWDDGQPITARQLIITCNAEVKH